MSLPAILTASANLENANLAALGIKHAFDTPPEVLADLPVALRFAEPTIQLHGSRMMGRYNIYHFKIEVHWPRGVLQEGIQQCFDTVRAYQDLYTANLNIGATCDVSGFREPACEGPVWLRYGPNTVETIGFIFHLWAKEILDDIWVDLGGVAPPPPPPPAATSLLLKTGEISAHSFFGDGAMEIGVAKGYTVVATPGNTDIQVAHYAGYQISFGGVGNDEIQDAAGGLATFLLNDRVRIKGSVLNDGEYTVTVAGVAGHFHVAPNIVPEAAGRVVTAYKVAALSNNTVIDLKTGREWARYTSSGLRVGVLSTGLLNWYDVATRFTLYNVANTVSVVAPDVLRITGGTALTQFHPGDMIQCAGFVNPINNLPNAYVLAATPSGPNLDIEVDTGNEVLVVEGAVGDALYLNTRGIYNYMAGANLGAGLSLYTDWRIPNDVELQSLRDMEAPTAAPNAAAFPGWPAGGVPYTWASTTRPSATTFGYITDFLGGSNGYLLKNTATSLCALVRN